MTGKPSCVTSTSSSNLIACIIAMLPASVSTDRVCAMTLCLHTGHPDFHVHSGESAIIVPRAVTGLGRRQVAVVAVAKHHTAVATTSCELFTWGSNRDGRLGYAAVDTQPTPRKWVHPGGHFHTPQSTRSIPRMHLLSDFDVSRSMHSLSPELLPRRLTRPHTNPVLWQHPFVHVSAFTAMCRQHMYWSPNNMETGLGQK